MNYEELIDQIAQECKKYGSSVHRVSQSSKSPKDMKFDKMSNESNSPLDPLIKILESFGIKPDNKSFKK